MLNYKHMGNQKRDYSLDFLKIVCTIIIVLHHYQQALVIRFDNGINFDGGEFYFGWVVELFFIISGMVTLKYINKIKNNEECFSSFAKKKFLRFIPLLTITAIVYEIVLYTHNMMFGKNWMGLIPTVWGTIITSLGIQMGGVFNDISVNYQTWYISVLLICYVVFYICVYLSKRLRIRHEYFFVALIFIGIAIKTYGINLPFLNECSARGYGPFFFGLILAGILENRKPNILIIIICAIITILFPVIIVYKYHLVQTSIVMLLTYIFYPSLIITFKYSIINKLFKGKFFATAANISFNVFMWHISVLIAFKISACLLNYDISIFESRKTMLIALAMCIIVGTLSYYILDRNINKKIKSKFNIS